MASSDWMALGRADEKSSDAKERTITVSGFPDGILPDDEMSDKLIIHFQKSKNGGGDVETIYYPAKIPGVAYIVFDDIKVAKRVLGKEHIFEDPRIHGRYKLKTSLYSEDVFTSVSVILDLSIFRKKYRLQDFVQHLKESFLSLTLSEIDASGRLSVTGPFSAIKKLREYVLSEIEALTYNDIFPSQRTEKQSSEYFSKNVLSLDMTPGKTLIKDIVTNKEMLFVDTDIYKYMIHICRNQYEKELKKHNIKASIHEMGEITVVYLENERSNQNDVKLAKKAVLVLIDKLQRDLRKEQILLTNFSTEERKNIEKMCKDLEDCYRYLLILPVDDCIGLVGSSSDCYNFIHSLERITGIKIKSRVLPAESKNTTAKGVLSAFNSSPEQNGDSEPLSLPTVMNHSRLSSATHVLPSSDNLTNIRNKDGPQPLHTFSGTQDSLSEENKMPRSSSLYRSSFSSKCTRYNLDETFFASLPLTYSSFTHSNSYTKQESKSYHQ